MLDLPSMPQTPDDHKELVEVAEKIRSGEYFREARNMYDFTVHDPMVERYFYVSVSVLAGLIFLVSLVAINGLYPLKRLVPFIVNSYDTTEELPSIHSLRSYKAESASEAVLIYTIKNYVQLREEYNIDALERNAKGIEAQSVPEVFAEYQALTAPTNPDSPIALYQRHSRRLVRVISQRQIKDGQMEVTFESTVVGKTNVKKSLWQADITFDFSGALLDEQTGSPKPFTFKVTRYRVKRLQDVE